MIKSDSGTAPSIGIGSGDGTGDGDYSRSRFGRGLDIVAAAAAQAEASCYIAGDTSRSTKSDQHNPAGARPNSPPPSKRLRADAR